MRSWDSIDVWQDPHPTARQCLHEMCHGAEYARCTLHAANTVVGKQLAREACPNAHDARRDPHAAVAHAARDRTRIVWG